MTDDRMALLELVEKAADADLVREMLAFAAERIMDAEVEMLTGAAMGPAVARRAAGIAAPEAQGSAARTAPDQAARATARRSAASNRSAASCQP